MPKIVYKCAFAGCEGVFETEEQAKKHEEYHVSVVKVEKQFFAKVPRYDTYPSTLNCEMSDGSIVQYVLR